MLEPLRKLLGKPYQPLNTIELSSVFLLHNYQYLSSLNPHIRVAPVLKSNAYGHGLIQIGRVLDLVKAPFFCVDSIYEAYELLKAGIQTKILIMGYIDPENLKVKKLPFSYAVYNEAQLHVINKYQKGAGVHIKFDSGMHRLGITLNELPNFITALKNCKQITIEGFMSHLAESEEPQSRLTIKQMQTTRAALDYLTEKRINPEWVHIANSAGILHHDKLELSTISNVARAGLDIYGIDPRPEENDIHLKPVLRYTSTIVQIKQIQTGDQVGYNGTFTAKKDMTIALLPIGFYDGVDRRLSNKGCVLIDGMICPIIGRVSMNITAIDITTIRNPHIGQPVVIFSDNPADPNTIKKSATLCETIPYDLLVRLAASTRRIVV